MSRDNYKYLISRYIIIRHNDDDDPDYNFVPIIICDSNFHAKQYVKYLLNFLSEIHEKIPKWPARVLNFRERTDEYYDNLANIDKKRTVFLNKIIWPLDHNMSDIFNFGINEPTFSTDTFIIDRVKYVKRD